MIRNLGDIPSAAKNLDKLSLIDLGSARPKFITYIQMAEMINSAAIWLTSKSLGPNDRIGILSENSIEFICLLFGALKSGTETVLINKKFKEKQIQQIINDQNIKILFSDTPFNTECSNVLIKEVNFNSTQDFASSIPQQNSTSFILYTSGSTGNPKAVKINHLEHIENIHRVSNFDSWSDKRISLIAAPLYHSSGLTTLEGSLYGNSTVILMPRFSSQLFLDAIEKFKINTIFCVPSMLAMALRDYKKQDLTSVKTIRSASAPLTENLVSKIKKIFSNAKIINSYGCTELGPGLFGPHPKGLTRPEHSVGYPIKEFDYDLTDQTLKIRKPNCDWVDTGDRFTVDHLGFYYFLDRIDDMFKSGGNKIYPLEIEKVLNQHDSILMSTVINIEDEIKGEKPYAFVILKNQQTITERDLKNFFLNHAPNYLLPRRIWTVEEFPLTGSNKVDKFRLKEIAAYNLANGL